MERKLLNRLIFLRGKINRTEMSAGDIREYESLVKQLISDLSLWGMSLNDTMAVFHDIASVIGRQNEDR